MSHTRFSNTDPTNDDGPDTFKPNGVAGLADFDGEGDKEVILVNQSTVAYLDETPGGETT